jgi:LacI family gluconate utilization system Gnt-I transcriptional repressor
VAALAEVSPAHTYSVLGDITLRLESILSDAQIQLFIGAARSDEKREEKALRAFLSLLQIRVVLVGSVKTDDGRSLLRRAGVPVVEARDRTGDLGGSPVVFSNAAAIRATAAHVVNLGSRRPTFMRWLSGLDSGARAARDGFLPAISGLSLGRIAPVVDLVQRFRGIEAGRGLQDATLREHPDTDVFSASDVFDTGAMLEAKSHSLEIHENLAVTGFGDFELSRPLSPTSSAVRTPNGTVGRSAAELLLERRALPVLARLGLGRRFRAERAGLHLDGAQFQNQHLSSTTEKI